MKRFTETEKWRDPWFRKLEPRLKLLWLWLCDQCDAAGVIDADTELAAFQIGIVVADLDLAGFGSERFERLPNGKWILQKFVTFQYGNLSPECKAHNPVFASLEKNKVSKGYPKGIQTLQEKERDKDKDIAKDTEGGVQRGESDPTVLRLFGLFGRRATTRLSEKEKAALKTAAVSEEDLEDVEAYYADGHPEWGQGHDLRRRDLATLLNNWPGEVTRAGAWKVGRNGTRPITPKPPRDPNLKSWQ